MKDTKFLHIMTSDSTIHNGSIIKMINESPKFDSNNHVFVIRSRLVYELNKRYSNCVFDEQVAQPYRLKELMLKADFIVLHGLCYRWSQLLYIPRAYIKKMVWVVWGHDLYNVEEKNSFKNHLKDIRWKIMCLKLKDLRSIGIGFKYDALRIRENLTDIPILNMPYFQGELDSLLDYHELKTNPIKIMVGHAAFEYLNHLDILEKLSSYKEKNIIISLVLAYGSRQYADDVKRRALNIFGESKVEIIETTMPYNEYVKYLTSVDIAIFDFKHQAALGNFYLLCLMGKKIYLNDGGILKQCLILEGAKTFSTKHVGEEPFDKFIQPIDEMSKNIMYKFADYYFNKETAENNWANAFEQLEESLK